MKAKLKFIIPVVIAVIAIIVAALCIDFTPQERTDVLSLMSTAQKYLIENQYEQAIAEFNKVIEIEPVNVDAYLGLAEAYVGLGDTDKAIEVLEKGYEITGDKRLKEAINNFVSDVNLDNSTNILSDDTVQQEQEELFEINEEMVSFIVPYKIEESGESFYSDIDIDTVYYENFEIEYRNDDYNNSYFFMKGVSDSRYNVITVGTSEWSVPKWSLAIWDNTDNKPPVIEYTVSAYRIDDTPIWYVSDKYNKNSQLMEREYYSENGLEYVDKYTYNEKGQVSTISSVLRNIILKYDSNGNIKEYGGTKYEYDLNGNLLKEESGSNNYTEYTYDSNGNCLTKDEYTNGNLSHSYVFAYDVNGNLIEQSYSYLDDEYGYKHEFKYDLFGNVIEYFLKENYEQASDQYAKFEYDNNGRLIKTEKEYYFKSNDSDTTTTTYQYDNTGKLVKETYDFADSMLLNTYTYIYNSDDLLQEIRLLQTNSSVIGYDSTSRYEYKYDSQGNRIKCDYYYEDEWKGSKECTEFIRIDIPKSVFEEVLKK